MLTEKVKFYINHNHLFYKQDRILIALSGGCDSVALLHILSDLNYSISAAHVNFNLRGADSDQDELFVENLCNTLDIQFFKKSFDTLKYAENNSLSIEEAARKLRYEWFDEIRIQFQFDCIAAGHHLDDRIETFFINLTKGTGIKGLRSISAKNNKIVRPLLFASRTEIENYCSENNLIYRTDQSNFDTQFLRNKFRHDIIPLFSEINNKFKESMQKNFRIYSEFELIYQQYIENEKTKIIKKIENLVYIDIKKLSKVPAPISLLYEIIHAYGFKSAQNDHIFNSLNDLQSGKIFLSKTHRLLKDRKFLIIDTLPEKTDEKVILIDNETDLIHQPVKLRFNILNQFPKTLITDKNTAFINVEKLSYPLKIRTPKKADYFFPFGMNGKKLLSDFFTDEKINLFEQEKIQVLTTSENEIIWIIGYRTDNRFKIDLTAEHILEIKRF